MSKPKEPYVTWYIPKSYYSLSSFDKFHFSSFFWDLMTPRNCLTLPVFTQTPLNFSELWFNIFFSLFFTSTCISFFLILTFFHLSVRSVINLILDTTVFFLKIPRKYHLLGTPRNFTNFQAGVFQITHFALFFMTYNFWFLRFLIKITKIRC